MKTTRRWIAFTAAMSAVAALATGAQAMTANATPDGDNHPAVVSLLQLRGPGVATMFCSGALLSPSVVVTASHCASYAASALPAGSVLVTNDPVLTNDPNGRITLSSLAHVSVVSSIAVNPKYKPGVGTDSYREDVSAMVVANPSALGRPGGIAYPSLPVAGLLDQLQRSGDLRTTPIQVMGYGTEAAVNGPGGHTFADSNERRYADMTISALNQQVIRESQKANQGTAGACYGDSGGPTFATINGTWTILGVTSTGDIPCWSTNTASRIDRATVLVFLSGVTGG
jgi:secreted trypsin-like serine protease